MVTQSSSPRVLFLFRCRPKGITQSWLRHTQVEPWTGAAGTVSLKLAIPPSPHFPWTLPWLACDLTHTPPPEQSTLRSVSKDTTLHQKPEMLWMIVLFWDKWSLFLWWFFHLSRKYFCLSPQYFSFPQLSSSWKTANASSAGSGGSGGQLLGPLGLGCLWSCSSGFFSCSYEDTSSCSSSTSTYSMMHFSHRKIWADYFPVSTMKFYTFPIRKSKWERGWEVEMYGESNMETLITICKIDSQWDPPVFLRELKWVLCINLEGWEEKAMASHSSTLAWKIPWMEEPGRLQSLGSQRVRQDWATSLSLFTFMHWGRAWQPTPVFLPGESQLLSMGSHGVGHDWRDLAAAEGWNQEGDRRFKRNITYVCLCLIHVALWGKTATFCKISILQFKKKWIIKKILTWSM